jgi:ParB family chromosome partitioning protein
VAKEAERLLGGTGWLPEPLRTPDVQAAAADGAGEAGATTLPAFLAEGDDDGDPTASDPEEPQPHVVAE